MRLVTKSAVSMTAATPTFGRSLDQKSQVSPTDDGKWEKGWRVWDFRYKILQASSSLLLWYGNLRRTELHSAAVLSVAIRPSVWARLSPSAFEGPSMLLAKHRINIIKKNIVFLFNNLWSDLGGEQGRHTKYSQYIICQVKSSQIYL